MRDSTREKRLLPRVRLRERFDTLKRYRSLNRIVIPLGERFWSLVTTRPLHCINVTVRWN
ncbi:MAG: hypothetical protein WBW88_17485 [Rhodothermales bacterium]